MSLSSTPYITPAGLERLRRESRALWDKRREVTQALAAAAAEGDRSENAEYIYRKRELAGIDRRIRYLQRRVPDLRAVDSAPADPDKVFFAAWVTVRPHGAEPRTFRIVGSDEADAEPDYISIDAPLARALLGREVGDQVEVKTPRQRVRYTLEAIQYAAD